MSPRMTLQRRRGEQASEGDRAAATATRLPQQIERQVLAEPSGGMAMDATAPAYSEPRLGHDYGRVHVQDDAPDTTPDGGASGGRQSATPPGPSGAVIQREDDESWWDKAVNSVESAVSTGAHDLAKDVADVPVLSTLANAGADMVSIDTDFLGGVAKGAGSLVGGVANMVEHPLQTSEALETMAEHVPSFIPGMPNPLKMAHGFYDVATGKEGLGDMANHVFNPIQSMKDDVDFGKQMVKGIAKPYEQEISQGKYAEALGRGAFDIGSIVLTGGGGAEVEGAADAAKAAEVASDAAKAGEVAADASDAARAAGAGDAADAARAAGQGAADRPDVFLGGLKRWTIQAGERSRGVTDAIREEIRDWAGRYGTIDGPPTTGPVHAGHTYGDSHVFTLPGEETQVAAQTAAGNLGASAAEKQAAEMRRIWNATNPDEPPLPVRPRGGY